MDIKKYMVFDTWARETRFHDTEMEAQEDFNEAIQEIQEGEELNHEVLILEVVQKAKIIKTVQYD